MADLVGWYKRLTSWGSSPITLALIDSYEIALMDSYGIARDLRTGVRITVASTNPILHLARGELVSW